MAPASNEEQFKFLISCIRYSNNGKVDFGQVAKECSIVSKGAAAKRYERMMRAHGIASTAASVKPNASTSRKPSGSGSTNPRKRKADQFIEDPNPADDEEAFGTNIGVKAEGHSQGQGQERGPRIKQQMIVKEERDVKVSEAQLQSLEDASELLRFYTPEEGVYDLDVEEEGYTDGGEYVVGNPSSGSGGGRGYASSSMVGGSSSGGGSGATGYGSASMSAGYGMSSSRDFGYGTGYDTAGVSGYGMNSMAIPPAKAMGYQQSYRVDTKGRQESPLLVE